MTESKEKAAPAKSGDKKYQLYPEYTPAIPVFQGRKSWEAGRLCDDPEAWTPAPESYKDMLAKSHNFSLDAENARDLPDDLTTKLTQELAAMASCGKTFVKGHCEGGHQWGKVLVCGREWCPTCGALDSDAHMRRYARLIPKVQQIATMGYLVVEWPTADRENLRTKKALSKEATRITRYLKRHGFDRGIRAWDYYGDPRCPIHHEPGQHNRTTGAYQCPKCPKGNEFSLNDVLPEDMHYNPHLNILLESGYLENLEDLKKGLRHVTGSNLIIRYQFADKPASMLHWTRYAVKPTFHNMGWDLEMVGEIAGYRGIWSWGKWDKSARWELSEQDEGQQIAPVLALQSGSCPDCHAALTWKDGIRTLAYIKQTYDCTDVGAGYVRLTPKNGT